MSSNQFYLEENTIIFNEMVTINLLDELSNNLKNVIGIIKFDLTSLGNLVKGFLKELLNLALNMNANGVIMYLSEEFEYSEKDYQDQIYLNRHSNNNPLIIFDSPKKVDVIFFNGIEKLSIDVIKKTILIYKNKEVVFNFSNLNMSSLNEFIPAFIGWITNSGLKNISFSQHYGQVNNVLEKRGVYCMVNVSNLISFPKKKSQKFINNKNKKINEFLKFANYGALQF